MTTIAHPATSGGSEPAAGPPDLPWTYVVLGVLVAYLPFVFLGYGTDIDVANVLRAGESMLDGDYAISRGPGAAPHEAATAFLDRVGGSILVNLASVAFGVLALWSVLRLLRHDRARWPALATLVLAANPWFWVASTSLGDFTWALGLGLAGAAAAARDRRVLAGVLFGLSIGCRASTVVLAVAWLVAERTGGADRADDSNANLRDLRADGAPTSRKLEGVGSVPWRSTLVTGGVLVVVGALCFVPPWLQADRSFDFLRNELDFLGWGSHAGRWLVKNLATATLLGAAVLLVGCRHLLSGLGRWRRCTVVRFAVLSLVLCELLFLRLPFKQVHLLPVVAAVALLVGAAPLRRRRWVALLVAAQLTSAFVGTTVAAPDVPDRAEGGRISLRPADGVIVNDARCRMSDLERGDWPDGTSAAEQAEATARAAANFVCQRDAWRDS